MIDYKCNVNDDYFQKKGMNINVMNGPIRRRNEHKCDEWQNRPTRRINLMDGENTFYSHHHINCNVSIIIPLILFSMPKKKWKTYSQTEEVLYHQDLCTWPIFPNSPHEIAATNNKVKHACRGQFGWKVEQSECRYKLNKALWI